MPSIASEFRPGADNHESELYGPENQIEVLGWGGHRAEPKGRAAFGAKLYTAICRKCSIADPELYGHPFLIRLQSLRKGEMNCACTKFARPSKEQYLVKVSRECSKRNYTYNGFIGEWNNGATRILLKCNVHNNVWDAELKNFLNGQGTCKRCIQGILSANSRYPDVEITEKLRASPGYSKDYHFWRIPEKTRIIGTTSVLFARLMNTCKKGCVMGSSRAWGIIYLTELSHVVVVSCIDGQENRGSIN